MALKVIVSMLHVQTFLLFILSLSVLAEIRVQECFKGTDEQPQGEATLSCPIGSVISISEALLGKNKWFECVLTEDDCMHSTKIFRSCEGLNSCTKNFRTYSARCGYSTILLISYKCIQVVLPTTPVDLTTTTSSRVGKGGDGPSLGIGVDGAATGSERERNVNPYRNKDTEDENESDVGLLVATICASLVTGVMLIIAIVMTIRRILNYPAWLQRRNRDDTSRWDACMERACFQVDKFPCFGGPESPEETTEQALRSQNKSGRVPISADEPVPNIQRTRMTPIGQEASESDVTVLPKNVVYRNEDPEGSDTSEHAQTTDTIETGVAQSSFKQKQRNQVLDSQSNNTNMEDIRNAHVENIVETLNNNNNNIVKFSCRNDGNFKNSTVTFGEKDPNQSSEFDIEKQCNIYHNNNNNDTFKDTYKDDIPGINVNGCGYDDNDGTDYTTIKAKYSAIVVPNTETSSRC